jgi:hypothetical protein
MNLKFSDSTVAVLCVLTVIATYGVAGMFDARDFETELTKERREWMTAISVCHRMYGPSTQPEYDDRGHLVCVSRRGEVLAYRGAP